VLAIAREGMAIGCKEAMFTLGDKPEDRWRQAREWLDAHGYDDTLSYARATVIRVLEETDLLTHLNQGVMSWQDFQRLKPVAPSMGMMLETTATRLRASGQSSSSSTWRRHRVKCGRSPVSRSSNPRSASLPAVGR
jgi:FO synthase